MLPLVVIAVAVALVWGAVAYRHTGLAGGCIAVLVCGSCFGHDFFNQGMITADRLLLALLLAIYAALRLRGTIETKSLSGADILLGLFFLVLVISTFTHDWSANGNKAAAKLVIFYGMPMVMYLIARELPLGERDLVRLMSFFALFGLYLGLTAVAERLELRNLVFPGYIHTSPNTEFLGRGRGPFLNPCANGLFLTTALTAALLLWPRYGPVVRGWLLGISTAALVGIYCTLTRCVWLAAGLSTVAITTLQAPRWLRAPLLVLVVLLGSGVAITKWSDLQAFKRDKHVSTAEMAHSASLRPMLALLAWQMFLDRPLLGCGFGQYSQQALNYFSQRWTDFPIGQARTYVQHNVFLAVLTETGLLGAGLFVALLGVWTKLAWRLWRSEGLPPLYRQQGLLLLSTLIAYVVNGMFHDMSIIAMVHMLVFFQAGLARGLTAAPAVAASAAPSTPWQSFSPEPTATAFGAASHHRSR